MSSSEGERAVMTELQAVARDFERLAEGLVALLNLGTDNPAQLASLTVAHADAKRGAELVQRLIERLS
jgi:hypothetical protein